MLRIEEIEREPLHRIAYLNAAERGGSETSFLDVLRAPTTGVHGCEAILITSDLQGRSPSWYESGASVLLGEALAEQLEMLSGEGVVPATQSIGVVLAGDLYSVPEANKRGGLGDVSHVWYRFSAGFRWVVGVAGNHDDFGRDKDKYRLMSEPNIHLLDGEVVELDGTRFGGVGYVIGNRAKRGRRSEEDQLAKISQVLAQKPDVLLLHEGPSGDRSQRGNDLIRSLALESETPMTICGHCHWDQPLSTSPKGKQFLNVVARAVLLVPR